LTMAGELVVIDTGLFSDALLPSREHIVDAYESDLAGRKLVISFQTAAEVLVRRVVAGLGSEEDPSYGVALRHRS
jgi:hypothetical protein